MTSSRCGAMPTTQSHRLLSACHFHARDTSCSDARTRRQHQSFEHHRSQSEMVGCRIDRHCFKQPARRGARVAERFPEHELTAIYLSTTHPIDRLLPILDQIHARHNVRLHTSIHYSAHQSTIVTTATQYQQAVATEMRYATNT